GSRNAASSRAASVVMALPVAAAVAAVTVPRLDLENLEGRRIDLRLELPPFLVRADYLVTSVVDLDPAHRPSEVGGHRRDRFAGFPVGHGHEAVVVGHRAADGQGDERHKNCQDDTHVAL